MCDPQAQMVRQPLYIERLATTLCLYNRFIVNWTAQLNDELQAYSKGGAALLAVADACETAATAVV